MLEAGASVAWGFAAKRVSPRSSETARTLHREELQAARRIPSRSERSEPITSLSSLSKLAVADVEELVRGVFAGAHISARKATPRRLVRPRFVPIPAILASGRTKELVVTRWARDCHQGL